MLNNTQHADDSQLQMLVFGDEHSDEFRVTAAHVETCEECQHRLSRLAGLERDEQEISELLSGYPQADDNEFPHRYSPPEVTCHIESLDFLAAPSHPEMLGRLGRYEIERVIGSGGMGIVIKGFDTELNRPVAIKVLARHLAHSGAARQRFARESRAAAAVVHEHVVAIHNVETNGELPFLVMQYVAGESLQARVDREGPLDVKEVLRIGIQAAAGLAAAHEQGVVHRDIKPANILLEKSVERVLITDFGLARTVDDASLTHTGIVTGTPHYMSPEQANGNATDHRTDLFSLGSVLYFMATGRPPFRAERAMGVLQRICHDRHRPVCDVNVDIPDELSEVIDRLLEKNAARRFASAVEVKESLSRLLARLQQRGLQRRSRARRFTRRHPLLFAGTIAAFVLAAAVTVLISTRPTITNFVSNASGKAADTIPSPNSAAPVEVRSEVLAAETAAYSVTSQEVLARLGRLEASFDESGFAYPIDSDFDRQVGSFHVRLDRIQN